MSVLLILLCACSATLAVPTAEYYALEEAELHFERFIQEHNKNYVDENEKQVRFQIFKDNLEDANRMNAKSRHAVFGITKFMDLTKEEFVNMYTGLKSSNFTSSACTVLSDSDIPRVAAPESFDWRQRNVVSRVKMQYDCGSCYAFSSIGNIESQYALKHQRLIELSEQEIVDCDSRSKGCHGGYMTDAFTSLMELGGVQTEQSYPYAGQRQRCSFNPSQVVVRVTGCNSYVLSSQETLKRLVYSVGPIAIALQSDALNKYRGGIMPDYLCNTGNINHAVLLVGYGTDGGIPYWLIKNSWDTSFGENGYIKVQRGETAHSCGLMNELMSTAVVA